MKKCTGCKEYLPYEMFAKAGLTPSGRQRYRAECLGCKSERDKRRNSDPEIRKLATERANAAKKIRKDYVVEYLKSHPCVDCGEDDIRVLEFDHVYGEKYMNISQMVGRKYSISAIQEEIDKCEIRCANHHRIVTAERGGWSILDYIN